MPPIIELLDNVVMIGRSSVACSAMLAERFSGASITPMILGVRDLDDLCTEDLLLEGSVGSRQVKHRARHQLLDLLDGDAKLGSDRGIVYVAEARAFEHLALALGHGVNAAAKFRKIGVHDCLHRVPAEAGGARPSGPAQEAGCTRRAGA